MTRALSVARRRAFAPPGVGTEDCPDPVRTIGLGDDGLGADVCVSMRLQPTSQPPGQGAAPATTGGGRIVLHQSTGSCRSPRGHGIAGAGAFRGKPVLLRALAGPGSDRRLTSLHRSFSKPGRGRCGSKLRLYRASIVRGHERAGAGAFSARVSLRENEDFPASEITLAVSAAGNAVESQGFAWPLKP